jgi:hypothetical protein
MRLRRRVQLFHVGTLDIFARPDNCWRVSALVDFSKAWLDHALAQECAEPMLPIQLIV